MSELKFNCHSCNQSIVCDEASAGMEVACPSCQTPLTIPELTAVEQRDIFLSYRREGGDLLARLVMTALKERGFTVFLDTESLKHGKFDAAILRHIELATDVVVICSQGALDRCANEDDWVRQEIKHALLHRKNIVRLLELNFQMPPKEALPADIAALADCQAVAQKSKYWDATIELLVRDGLKSEPDSALRQIDEQSEEGQTLAWTQLRARMAAGIGLIILLMVLVSLPSLWNHALNQRDHRLGLIGKEKAGFGMACTLLILVGAWLSLMANRLGPWLILASSMVMVVANLVLIRASIKALQPFVIIYHQPIPTKDYFIWSAYVIPFVVLAWLYRKGK